MTLPIYRLDRIGLAAAGMLWSLLPGAIPLAAQQPQLGGQPGYTLRVTSNLVVLDVMVSAKDGSPEHDLKASDFALLEDGKPQVIRNFSEHRAPKVIDTSSALERPKLKPGIFTNFAPMTTEGPANLLLLDMLNTPLRDQAYAKQQILDYVKHAPAGSRIAIFGLANKLTILQGFTSDPGVLAEALSGKKALRSSSLLNDSLGGGGGDGAGATGVSDALNNLGTGPDLQAAVANAQQFESETASYQLQVRSQITLDAMNEIARYLANIPGRKNLIWFSGSFPVSILPDPDINNGFATLGGSEAEFRETMGLFAKNQIALFPIDARGLTTSGAFNASTSGAKYVRDPRAIGKDITKYNASNAAENATMLEAARETGGVAFVNTNGLTAALAEAINSGSNYYTLTYSPSNQREDGAYRRIDLKVPGRQLTLTYRSGYYADKLLPAGPVDSAAADSHREAEHSLITRTMVRGAPTPTQVLFTVRVQPASAKLETAAVTGNEIVAANPEAKPPYTRFAVDFAVDQHELSFSKAQGGFRGAFEFITFIYDADGTLINRAGSIVHLDLTPQRYAAFLEHPLAYSQDMSVPQLSGLFARIAVHDLSNDHVGAVEIPLDSVRNLPPLEPGTPPVK